MIKSVRYEYLILLNRFLKLFNQSVISPGKDTPHVIIPRPLRKGDTIGVTAPSFGVTDQTDIARFSNGVSKLNELGYDVRCTPDVFPEDPEKICAPAEQRVDEFVSLLNDDSVGCIIAAKGGDYQIDMLPIMDWDAVEKNPKWIQGYSDNTVLLFKITAEHDIATVYGSNFGDFGMEPWHRSVSENLQFLGGDLRTQRSFKYHEAGFKDRSSGLEPISEDERTIWRSTSRDVSFQGRLIGGCMDVLEWYHHSNKADVGGFIDRYSSEGIVWFMETYDMTEERVRRMFRGMKKDGWLEGASGFVFGRPLFYTGNDYADVISEELSELEVPLVFDADVGHKAPRMVFANGLPARFDIKSGACTLTYQ